MEQQKKFVKVCTSFKCIGNLPYARGSIKENINDWAIYCPDCGSILLTKRADKKTNTFHAVSPKSRMDRR